MRAAGSFALALVLGAVSVCACSDEPPFEAREPATTGEALIVRHDLPVADVTEVDVFAAAGVTDAPIVVLLHGTAGDRTRLHPMARVLASGGAVVFVPSWPVIEALGTTRSDPARFLGQVEAVTCSLRFARAEAARYGGDPDDLTVVGYSGGASVGIAASLAVTPTEPEPPCLAGVDHRPVRFVGLAGDYHGDYQGARTDAAYASIDPFSIDPSPHVEVRLLHGLDDRVVNAYVSGELVDHLVRRGVDARLVVTGHGHGDVIDPQDRAGAWVTDQVGLLVHARPSVFDAEPTSHLELGFDGRSCTYRGRTTLTVGDVAEIELRNATATGVSLGLASVAPDLDRAVLTAPTDPIFVGSVAKFGLTVSNRPSWILWGGFRFVPVRTVTPWRWAITDLDVDWLPVCFVDQPGHGRHGIVVLGTEPSGTAALVEIE